MTKPARRRVTSKFTQPSLTKQSFKDECDINMIMARYQKTGVIDHYAKHAPQYGETSAHTFTEAQMIVANAQSMFNELPSKARQAFNNDPAEFLGFCEHEPDLKTMIDLGLTKPGVALPSQAAMSAPEGSPEPVPEAPEAS